MKRASKQLSSLEIGQFSEALCTDLMKDMGEEEETRILTKFSDLGH